MSGRTLVVAGSIDVAADARVIWEQLADPAQMARWSPENTGARTTSPTSRPLGVGETFVGSNRRGRARWHTRCVVTASDPGRRFAFRVEEIGLGTPRLRAANATWDYLLQPLDEGTRVTETWHDDRPWPDAVAGVFDRVVTGGRPFAVHQRRNIARTLSALKRDLERPTT